MKCIVNCQRKGYNHNVVEFDQPCMKCMANDQQDDYNHAVVECISQLCITTFNPRPGLWFPSLSFPWVVPMVIHIEA